ncbi:hypothetical protein [Hydrogenophaga sp.]|uniref:hypothetical protein n=1 Tax=Hydrogenophaga sp. TaxID=1904254 RepID=UPI0027228CD8|nr:hypothetical protein [Hydrogenophaga sp.]MDO9433978.1 hypothetical protein [Hydrogenophaga sp.]
MRPRQFFSKLLYTKVINMEERWCSGCGQAFTPRPQSPRQTYCHDTACQKERKLLWQKTKRRSDEDYAANQAKANAVWVSRNPDYWRRYRANRTEGDIAARNVQALLAEILGSFCDDTSSWKQTRSNKTEKRRVPCSIEIPLDERGVLVLKLRVEIVLRKQKSSPRVRKETT